MRSDVRSIGLAADAPRARAASAPQARVYGAGPIKRMLQRHGRSQRGRDGTYTPHNGEREIARRLRQAERDAWNRANRYFRSQGITLQPPGSTPTAATSFGLSRRGRVVAL